MRILHTSDLHGNTKFLKRNREFDVWVDSGDFFHNWSRGDISIEIPKQTEWFNRKAESLAKWLGDRPAVIVPGNHDYVDLAELLRAAGCNAYSADGQIVDIEGIQFTGFREIPWIAGEWNYERLEHDLRIVVEECFKYPPNILVTHTPPAGILDDNFGCTSLANALTYFSHNIRMHLFGHIHKFGGYMHEEMGIKFYNNATKTCLIEYP